VIQSRFWRRTALIAHVTASVGWVGAIVASLGLAIAALNSTDAQTVRSAYVALDILGRYVLVPFAFAALLGGIAQSFITKWGLFRHYWVIFKLLITIFATGVLLLYLRTLAALADFARDATAGAATLEPLRTPTVVLHAVAALVLLLVATALAVYKPQGMTAYGQRKERENVRE
jgi:hypothetical protein